MEEYQIEQDDVPRIIDYKENQLDQIELTNFQTITIDETIVDNLTNLDLDNLVNLQLNGTESLKLNFEAIIQTILQQQSQMKLMQNFLQKDQQNQSEFQQQIGNHFTQINKINQNSELDRIKNTKFSNSLQDTIKRNEKIRNAERDTQLQAIQSLQDVITEFHVKHDKQKKENISISAQFEINKKLIEEQAQRLKQQEEEIQGFKRQIDCLINADQQNFLDDVEEDKEIEQKQDKSLDQEEFLRQQLEIQDLKFEQEYERQKQQHQQQNQQIQLQQLQQQLEISNQQNNQQQQVELKQQIQKQLQQNNQQNNLQNNQQNIQYQPYNDRNIKMKISQIQIQIENICSKVKDMNNTFISLQKNTVQELPRIRTPIKRKSSIKLDLQHLQNPDSLQEQMKAIQQKLSELEDKVDVNDFADMKYSISGKANNRDVTELQLQFQGLQKQIQSQIQTIENGQSQLNKQIMQQQQKPQIQQLSEINNSKLIKIPYLEEQIIKLTQQIKENDDIQQHLQQQTKENIELIKNSKVDKDGYNYYDEKAHDENNKKTQVTIKSLLNSINRMNQKAVNDECTQALMEDRINKVVIQIDTLNSNIKDLQNDNSADLEKTILKNKEELLEQIKQFDKKLDLKSNKTEINECEEILLQKLDKCIEALMKKMADKNDTKKALLFLEKRINDLYQLSFEKKQGPEDDPLIAKRPLFWSCMSCDIDVEKYRGKLGEYRNWAVFPPKETTPDRMGRFGVSYYNMMRSRKLGNQNDRDKLAQFQNMTEQRQVNDNLNIKSIEIQEKEDLLSLNAKNSQNSQKSYSENMNL